MALRTSQEEYENLREEEREAIFKRSEELQEAIRELFKRLGALEEEWQKARREFTKAAEFLIGPRFAQVRSKYSGNERIQEYLDEVQRDIMENVKALQAANKQPPFLFPNTGTSVKSTENVIVDHFRTKGAPVVEEYATYTNLFGAIERRVQFSIMTANFTPDPGRHLASGQRGLSGPFRPESPA